MKVLDRYIAGFVISGSLIALAGLTALFSFIAFVDDLGTVGRGDYTLTKAIGHAFLTLPREAYPLFPLGALIGTLMGLGALAANSELVAMRAAGVSVYRLTLSVLRASIVLVLVAMLVGEVVAPPAERYAQQRRSLALIGQGLKVTDAGFWIRDGRNFVNIRRALTGEQLAELRLYEFDQSNELRRAVSAERATYTDGHWLLEGVKESIFEHGGVRASESPSKRWNAAFKPELVEVVQVQPESLSALELSRYVQYLASNELRTSRYELAFWTKLTYPVATAVMMFLSVPLVLGRLRSGGAGQRIMVGVLLGISFHVIKEISGHLGLVYGAPPLLSAVAPVAAFALLGIALFRRFE